MGPVIEQEKKYAIDLSLEDLYEDKQVTEAMESSKRALARSLYDEGKFEQAALILKRCKVIVPMNQCQFGNYFKDTDSNRLYQMVC
jgi:hypothetical protein